VQLISRNHSLRTCAPIVLAAVVVAAGVGGVAAAAAAAAAAAVHVRLPSGILYRTASLRKKHGGH